MLKGQRVPLGWRQGVVQTSVQQRRHQGINGLLSDMQIELAHPGLKESRVCCRCFQSSYPGQSAHAMSGIPMVKKIFTSVELGITNTSWHIDVHRVKKLVWTWSVKLNIMDMGMDIYGLNESSTYGEVSFCFFWK